MNASINSFREELRSSLETIVFLSWLPIIVGAWFLGSSLWVLASFCLVAFSFVLSRWKPAIGKWFVVAAISGMIFWLSQAFPLGLVLMVIPLGLTATLIGLRAALTVGLGQTFVILILSSPATREISGITLATLWSVFGVMVITYWPIYTFARWAHDYYHKTQKLLSEALDQKVSLLQSLEDLAHASQQLNAANERVVTSLRLAESAQIAKAAFVAKVSHEFRTPLNMIIGLLDLLVQSPELYGDAIPPAVSEDLQIIYRNSQYLTSLVNDVLDLSQSESGRMTLYREQVSVREIFEEAEAVVSPLIKKKGVYFEESVQNNLPDVYCDRTRIRQVVLNLLSNAARFVERGNIVLSAVQRNDYIVISISDTGPGISPADSERIFEPFCQGAERLWQDKGGSGLGLTICRQLVELHGGRIWLESEVGCGSTFYFDLPISQPMTLAPSPGRWIMSDWEWKERVAAGNLPDLKPLPKIVLCDESGELNGAFARYPETIDLIDVSKDAPSITAAQSPIDVYVLTRNDQWNLWPAVEQAKLAFSNTTVIGCVIPDNLQRGHDIRAIEYLTKPITREKLQSAVRKVDRPAQTVLVVEDDPDASRLITRLLRSLDGHLEVLATSTGEEALSILSTSTIDLLLLDMILPDMDGWEVVRRKAQDPKLQDIPVIFASAQDPTETPMRSQALLMSIDRGIPLNKIPSISLQLSKLLSQPD